VWTTPGSVGVFVRVVEVGAAVLGTLRRPVLAVVGAGPVDVDVAGSDDVVVGAASGTGWARPATVAVSTGRSDGRVTVATIATLANTAATPTSRRRPPPRWARGISAGSVPSTLTWEAYGAGFGTASAAVEECPIAAQECCFPAASPAGAELAYLIDDLRVRTRVRPTTP